jgi:hypothetical protein
MEPIIQHPRYDHQETLVAAYCSEAEERLKLARNREEAVALAEELCREFEGECESDIVTIATRTYVDQLVDQLWGDGRAGDQ